MENLKINIVLCTLASCLLLGVDSRPTRWCVTTIDEEMKCKQLKKEIENILAIDKSMSSVLPDDFQCIKDNDLFGCMGRIEKNEADLMTLDSGLGHFAGRQHNMMPIMAEKYGPVVGKKPTYYSVALTKASNRISFDTLKTKKICFPGIGMSAGWVYPIGRLLKDSRIEVRECNAIVKSVTEYFNHVCLPGALSSFYNPFGNNATVVCKLCQNQKLCSTSDAYGGYDGAFECLASGVGELAFLRHDTLDVMTTGSVNFTDTSSEYKLFCPDGRMSDVSDYLNCNWGEVSSNIIMTSAVRDPIVMENYKKYLLQFEKMFGPQGTHVKDFKLFTSESSYNADVFNTKLYRKNLMFNDMTTGFFDIGDYIYNTWVDATFTELSAEMSRCPSEPIRWCVISMAEKIKCEAMLMAFKAKSLKPDLDCMYGGNTTTCLEMITRGDADLINLDAGDIYVAGKKYGLVPIAAEDYGDTTMQFRAVAVARKTDKSTTLFNMKGKRSCQPGIGRGDGWIVPLNIFIETEQFLPEDCSAFKNIGELFVRSCIPGALDSEYNPYGEPINLCEGCAAGGYRKCRRNSEEQYYGASGAFRCLVEKGGDIAFVRHLTVRDNTDGRNHAIWSRNRRSDDYELMCKDGRRLNIDRFAECHLGFVPSNAIVTSAGRDTVQKDIIWSLINYGQQFFSSDIDGDFHMFDSGLWYTDLLFTDAAVRLIKIPEDQQNYKDWLGESFIAQIENLEKYTCVYPGGASFLLPSLLLLIITALFSRVLS